MTNALNLTAASLSLFAALYDDAGNWSGSPLFGGNVGGSKADRGNLTDLKIKGLVTTDEDEGDIWVNFTEAGHAFAKTIETEGARNVSRKPVEALAAPAALPVFFVTARTDSGLDYTAPIAAATKGDAIKEMRAAVKLAGISRKLGTIHFRATL